MHEPDSSGAGCSPIPRGGASGTSRRGHAAPDICLAACEGLDVVPGRCVAFDDSRTDVRSATAAGAPSVAVPSLTSVEFDADLVVSALHAWSATRLEASQLAIDAGVRAPAMLAAAFRWRPTRPFRSARPAGWSADYESGLGSLSSRPSGVGQGLLWVRTRRMPVRVPRTWPTMRPLRAASAAAPSIGALIQRLRRRLRNTIRTR